MMVYELARRQADGSWAKQTFQAADDDDAVDYVLRVRTATACELRRSDFLFATFDGAIEADLQKNLEVAF